MRYRAFLSYSHADSDFAAKFHKDLERWRGDRGLVGRETGAGPVPRDLRPIFRDRDDFAGGRTLAAATNEALEASDFLILLCSPAAARSAYVNEEVRSFKALGGTDRIIPVIIDGEPGDAERNCFPDALLRKIGPDGQLTDEVEDRLAADARDEGDGPRRALAKVIAGLLGVPFDEIVRRAELAQRRRNRLYVAVAATMTLLAVLAGLFGWLAETRRIAADRNYQAAIAAADDLLGQVGEELIRTEGISLATTKRLIGRSESIYDQLLVSLPDAFEVKTGKIAALSIFARAYFDKGDVVAASDALAEAERLTEELLGAQPDASGADVPLALMRAERARLLTAAGRNDEALEVFDRALAVLTRDTAVQQMGDDRARYVAGIAVQLALLKVNSGDLDGGGQVLDAAAAMVDTWQPRSEKHGMDWRVLGSTVVAGRATIEEARGNLARAYELMRSALDVLESASAERPDWPQIRLMLANSTRAAAMLSGKLGNVDRAAAENARADALTEDLGTRDDEDQVAQAGAAGVAGNRALARLRSGDTSAVPALMKALEELRKAVDGARGYRWVADSARPVFSESASALAKAGYHTEALHVAQTLIAVLGRLDPAHTDPDVRAGLAAALRQAATAEENRQQLTQAHEYAERALAIEQALQAKDASRLATLADTEWTAATLLWRLSRRAEAEQRYARLVEHFRALKQQHPEETYYASSFSWTCVNLGELKALNGNVAGATTVFDECVAHAEQSLAKSPDNRDLKLNMAWAAARKAVVADDGARWRQVVRLLTEADADAPLSDLEEELLTVARLAAP